MSLSAEITQVSFGAFEIEGLMDEKSDYYVAVPQVATLLELNKKQASRDIKNLLGERLQFKKIKTRLCPTQVNAIDLTEFEQLLHILANQGNSQAVKLWNLLNPDLRVFERKRSSRPSLETEIQKRLRNRLGGVLEKKCPAGYIDILTNTQLIEIKVINHWKCGIGQLLVYGIYYPHHEKRLHIFGKASSSLYPIIQKYCSLLGILLTHE